MSELKHFPRIREARELLLAQAEELIKLKLKIAKEALDARNYDAANDAVNFLLLHMPSVEGKTVIDQDIDKPKLDTKTSIPVINIGVALGGINKPKELPISIKVIDTEKD